MIVCCLQLDETSAKPSNPYASIAAQCAVCMRNSLTSRLSTARIDHTENGSVIAGICRDCVFRFKLIVNLPTMVNGMHVTLMNVR